MSIEKRYYWLKLKESFMTSDTVDYLMSLPNGSQYVVLYQILCLKTINTNGRLSRQIGEIIIPYDIEKIQRDCKWFSTDTIRVALDLFKRFGLVFEDIDGTLVMADHVNLVGSETEAAVRMRNLRAARSENTLPEATEFEQCSDFVTTDNRYIDIRDIEGRDIDTTSSLTEDVSNLYPSTSEDLPCHKSSAPDGAEGSSKGQKQQKKLFPHDGYAYQAAVYLDKSVRKVIPSAKAATEDTLQRWAADFDKCNRLDDHSWDEIRNVLVFARKDTFWQTNILSGSKFRKQYMQLAAKMNCESRAPAQPKGNSNVFLEMLNDMQGGGDE